MRFVVTGEWSRNHLLRLILGLFLIFTSLFWVTNFILFFAKMGLTPASVVAYYLGDPEHFRQPRSLLGLAEVAHFHLFAMGILVMTLTHLLLFVPAPLKVKGSLVLVAFSSALFDEAGGWLVRFVHPAFAYLKIGAFLALQASLGGLVVLILMGLIRPERNAYTDTEAK